VVANERKILRCAVYTRKSSEHGLEQDFNSLHAQREACESFIKSQQGEGWRPSRPPTMTVDSPAGPWSDLLCCASCPYLGLG